LLKAQAPSQKMHDCAKAAERVFVRGLKLAGMKTAAQRIETADTIELVP
jgi:hypothetical protein